VAIGTVLTLGAGGVTSARGVGTGAAAVCTLDGEFVAVDASGTLGDWMAVADAFLWMLAVDLGFGVGTDTASATAVGVEGGVVDLVDELVADRAVVELGPVVEGLLGDGEPVEVELV